MPLTGFCRHSLVDQCVSLYRSYIEVRVRLKNTLETVTFRVRFNPLWKGLARFSFLQNGRSHLHRGYGRSSISVWIGGLTVEAIVSILSALDIYIGPPGGQPQRVKYYQQRGANLAILVMPHSRPRHWRVGSFELVYPAASAPLVSSASP